MALIRKGASKSTAIQKELYDQPKSLAEAVIRKRRPKADEFNIEEEPDLFPELNEMAADEDPEDDSILEEQNEKALSVSDAARKKLRSRR